MIYSTVFALCDCCTVGYQYVIQQLQFSIMRDVHRNTDLESQLLCLNAEKTEHSLELYEVYQALECVTLSFVQLSAGCDSVMQYVAKLSVLDESA